MSDLQAVDYSVFKRKVREKTGLDLDSYKQTQMERRLRSVMERSGAQSFQQYYRMIDADAVLMDEFLNRVTINVSELFRNPEQYEVLERRVIPDLLSRSDSLSVWSAGCSYGQEPYSLAICLAERRSVKRHSILATDIDCRAMEHARKGVFSTQDARSLSDERRERWFKPDGETLVADQRLRETIEVRRLDLLKDAFPARVDLIVCRNVVIYFSEDAKDKLYRRFYASLKPGGYLFVGGTERVAKSAEMGYTNGLPFFYQKPPSG